MSVDARLFVYALESHLARLRWRQDDALAALAVAVRELERLQAECASLDMRILTAAALPPPTSIDVRRAGNALEFVTAMRRQRALAGQRLEAARVDERARRESVLVARREVEKLEQDRSAKFAEFTVERGRVLAREADHDWTARARWQALNGGEVTS